MFKEVSGVVYWVRDLGGPGSGNWGHAGIPGYHGGSLPKDPSGGNKRVVYQKVSNGGGLDEDLKPSDFTPRGYSEDEAKLMIDYKGNGYNEINLASLERVDPRTVVGKKIDAMDKIINDSRLAEPTTVYHGMGPSEAAMFDDANVGSEFSNKAFYSTSLDSDAAVGFADGSKVLKINLPKGSRGFVYGDTKYESEVVLPRNQKFVITKIEDKNDVMYYYVSPVRK